MMEAEATAGTMSKNSTREKNITGRFTFQPSKITKDIMIKIIIIK